MKSIFTIQQNRANFGGRPFAAGGRSRLSGTQFEDWRNSNLLKPKVLRPDPFARHIFSSRAEYVTVTCDLGIGH